MFMQALTVTSGQAYPKRFHEWIDYLKNESVTCCHNQCWIQIYIPALMKNLWIDKIALKTFIYQDNYN